MTGVTGRHWRAVIGLLLMLLGVGGYAAVLFRVGAAPEACVPTWMQLLRQYGFPAGLLIGGYNLFQPTALREIAMAWKARKA